MKCIVAATDFTPASDIAVRQAAALARRAGARLVVVHAANIEGAKPDLFERITGRADAFRQDVRAELAARKKQLENVRDGVGGAEAGIECRMVDGFPDEAIARAAVDFDADLVVVGTRRGEGPILLGSVSERVLRASPRPVLVARAPVAEAGFARILAAVDFEPASERAVEMALAVAADGATVDLLHARGDADDPDPRGEQWVERFGGRGATVRYHSHRGHPSQQILDHIDRERYDLVALGSHGHRGWRRWWLGSLAEATVRYAPCSALVAPPESASV